MLEEIKAFQKSNDHTAAILNKMMRSGEFRNANHAFVILRATMKAIRDRIGPGEVFHLAGQLPALLRGYFFEGYDLSKIRGKQSYSKGVNEFLGEVKDYLKAYDFMDLEKVVPIALNVLLEAIDEGEASQVMGQLPKDVQDFRAV